MQVGPTLAFTVGSNNPVQLTPFLRTHNDTAQLWVITVLDDGTQQSYFDFLGTEGRTITKAGTYQVLAARNKIGANLINIQGDIGVAGGKTYTFLLAGTWQLDLVVILQSIAKGPASINVTKDA